MHLGRRQPDLLKDRVQSESHFGICSRPQNSLVDCTKHTRPKGQPVTEGKHWYPRWFLEGEHSTRTNQTRNGAQHGNRIGKKHQNVTTDDGVKRPIGNNVVYVDVEKAHVTQSRSRYTGLRTFNRS